MNKKSDKNGLGILFGLIFVIAGLAAAYGSAGHMIVRYIATSHWVEVPASIHSVDLITSGSDSATYTVKSTYSYQYNGAQYQSNRVSLSSGRDNIGSYWEALAQRLQRSQSSNEASAFVNPENPAESVLDRTLRWKSVLFGSLFLFMFCGAGALVMWASFNGKLKGRSQTLVEQGDRISSNQKSTSLVTALMGLLFLILGGSMSLLMLPEALRDGEYAALFLLLFVFVGVWLLIYALKTKLAYRRFGPTPLALDPPKPGVGGQLGGQFTIHAPNIGYHSSEAQQLWARATCVKKTKVGKRTNIEVLWQSEAPVYLKQTADGVVGSFLFDLPQECEPSSAWRVGTMIEWNITVEGDFKASGLGKLGRQWCVVVGDDAAAATGLLNIPQHFLNKADEKLNQRVKASALKQISVTDDSKFVHVLSNARRAMGGKLIGMLIGAVVLGLGVAVILQESIFGYVIGFFGALVFLFSLHSLGKSITVQIDKQSRIVHARKKWFGIPYANQQAELTDIKQLTTRLLSTAHSTNQLTKHFVLEFKPNDDKAITVAHGIIGEGEADIILESIVERIEG